MSQKVNNLEFASNENIFFDRYIEAMPPCISELPPTTCISEPSINNILKINVSILCIKTEETPL